MTNLKYIPHEWSSDLLVWFILKYTIKISKKLINVV